MTHKPWTLAECCDHYAQAGLGGASIWRDVVDPDQRGVGLDEAVRIVRGSGLAVPAYVRGGFFPDSEPTLRQQAVDLNRSILDEAAALGAEQVVLVVGAVPGMPLVEARRQVAAGIAECLPHAESVGVKLSIEPLHPMYAADRSCVNRMAEARAIVKSWIIHYWGLRWTSTMCGGIPNWLTKSNGPDNNTGCLVSTCATGVSKPITCSPTWV